MVQDSQVNVNVSVKGGLSWGSVILERSIDRRKVYMRQGQVYFKF